jgi:hypothetical protein
MGVTLAHSGYRTVVRSASGHAELRSVVEVKEWRIESELDSGSVSVNRLWMTPMAWQLMAVWFMAQAAW